MKVLLLGGNGFLGPHVVKQLQDTYELRITDIVPHRQPARDHAGRCLRPRPSAPRPPKGTDCNHQLLSTVLRHDRKIAFDVSTLTGTYNGIRAACRKRPHPLRQHRAPLHPSRPLVRALRFRHQRRSPPAFRRRPLRAQQIARPRDLPRIRRQPSHPRNSPPSF